MKSAEAGFSRYSLEAYRSDLSDLFAFFIRVKKNPAAIHEAELRDYLYALHERGLKESAIARKISVIRQFYQFLYLEGGRGDNPAKNLRAPKLTRNLPHPPDEEEINALLKTAERMPHPYNLRTVALIELAYCTGGRAGELVSLPLKSVLSGADHLFLFGKGGKDRVVPLSVSARKAVSDYLKYRFFFTGGRENPFLFASSRTGTHITRIRFFQILKELACVTGIDQEKISPHNFRHAFASDLIAGGADLRAVQTLLGHKNIETTEIYTHVRDKNLYETVEKHHPMSHKRY